MTGHIYFFARQFCFQVSKFPVVCESARFNISFLKYRFHTFIQWLDVSSFYLCHSRHTTRVHFVEYQATNVELTKQTT